MKIIDFSTRRRVTIAMFTIGILMFGLVSLSRLNVNLLPELSYPTLTVRTEYEGAAPAEVENLITKPVEEALGVVTNVQQVRSISRSGQSDVTLEFAWGTNMDFAGIDVREKLDALQLPREADRPVILKFDPTLDPVVRYALYKDDAGKSQNDVTISTISDTQYKGGDISTLKKLRLLAEEQIKKNIESTEGVASVKLSGGLEEEVEILIDEKRLSHLSIPVDRIGEVLSAENVNLSGGRLEEGSRQYLVRTVNQFQSVSEIGNVVVADRGERPVYLHDVAEIRQGFKEREAITRIDGKEAVEIAIYKEGDANTVRVAEAVGQSIAGAGDTLPEGIELEKVYDQSTFISSAINEVAKAGVIGGVLAVIVLYLFLRNIWSTVIISLSIPVSVIATFNLMYSNDITLNIMSLGGITLGIGLLVDNSIVVLENIARHRDMGKSVLESARDGAGEVGMAVVASTLTTISVFFPLVFVEGIAGQLFQDQALTVTFSLLASLLVAVTLIPMMSSLQKDNSGVPETRELPEPKTKFGRGLRAARLFLFTTIPTYIVWAVHRIIKGISAVFSFLLSPILNGFENSYNKLENYYTRLLTRALERRLTVLATAIAIFAGTMLLVPKLGVELIPSLSQGEFIVEFKMPPGTPLNKTDQTIKQVQLAANSIESIGTTFSVAGSGNRLDASPDQGGENWGELNVMLAAGATRETEQEAMDKLRSKLRTIPGLNYKFSRPELFTFDTPVQIEVSGYNLDDLKKVSDRIATRIDESARFTDVKSTMQQGNPEIQIRFDRSKAAAMGLNVREIADGIVHKIRGDVATQYSWHDRKIDVLVRANEEDRNSLQDIQEFVINPESDRPLPLSSIATITAANGPGEIRRLSQQRVALVTANLGYGDLGAAQSEIQNILDETKMVPGVSVTQGGQNEEMSASFRSLLFALALAVFLVYLVMASQFESLLHPFVILFSIPLALIGVVWALWLTGSTISVIVFIGLILLAGIVVNNAIVLIDLVNQLRERGMEKMEAIVNGSRLRLRPILMTTLTTTLGLLPLAITFGEGSELRAPMAITVIGGLLVSTLLTLVVIPVFYAVVDRKSYKATS